MIPSNGFNYSSNFIKARPTDHTEPEMSSDVEWVRYDPSYGRDGHPDGVPEQGGLYSRSRHLIGECIIRWAASGIRIVSIIKF